MAIELGKGYVQIVPSARGIKGAIEKELSPEMASAGKASGQTLGTELVGKLKGLLAAAGIGAAVKSVLDAGAELQQSYGGLETIYGKASYEAKIFAEQAYKAGISANDFAEQAVSFGASLRQAYGGDTVKAITTANMAIKDMADNSAKMGTDIASIQNAYQGFAKGNYTMLDNLKLGYGGTKGEMERLLADAQKLSGIEYNISNLADVYNAIHVIQEELGVAGVAAAEAKETFSGSFGAMRAAAENFMAALATGGHLEASLRALISTAVTFIAGNLVPMLMNILTALPGALMTGVPVALSAIQEALASLWQQFAPSLSLTAIESGAYAVTNAVTGFLQELPAMMDAGMQAAQTFVGGILADLPTLIDTGTQIVGNFMNGIQATLPDVLLKAGELIVSFVGGIIDALPQVIESGVNLVHTWANGISNGQVNVEFAIYNVIKGLLAKIVENLPEILSAGIQIIAELITGIVRWAPRVLTLIGEIIADLTKSFTEYDWASLGKRILEGIADGLKKGASLITDAAKSAASGAFEAAKKFLKIGSPSKLFRDEVGAMMAEGMAIGFEDNLPTAQIQQSLAPMGDIVPDAQPTYSYGGFSINVYGAPGQDVNELADIVGRRINEQINARKAVFA